MVSRDPFISGRSQTPRRKDGCAHGQRDVSTTAAVLRSRTCAVNVVSRSVCNHRPVQCTASGAKVTVAYHFADRVQDIGEENNVGSGERGGPDKEDNTDVVLDRVEFAVSEPGLLPW